MGFIETIKEKAKANKQCIVLPETSDIRTLQAAHTALKEKIANIILIGDKEQILSKAKADNLDLSKADFLNPQSYDSLESLVELFVELRGHKGMTQDRKSVV